MKLAYNLLCTLTYFTLVVPSFADFIAVTPSVSGVEFDRVNEQTGAYQIIASVQLGTDIGSLTRDTATNTWYAVDYSNPSRGHKLYTFDPNTGALSVVADLHTSGSSTSPSFAAVAAAPNGLLYATGGIDTLYSIDPRSGQVSAIGSMGGDRFRYVTGLAFSPDGTLYGQTANDYEAGNTGPGLFRIDLSTATTTVLSPPSLVQPFTDAIAFAPDGTLWSACTGSFMQLDPATGAPISDSTLSIPRLSPTSFAFLPAASVPEPASLLLFASGGALVLFLRRRKEGRARPCRTGRQFARG